MPHYQQSDAGEPQFIYVGGNIPCVCSEVERQSQNSFLQKLAYFPLPLTTDQMHVENTRFKY